MRSGGLALVAVLAACGDDGGTTPPDDDELDVATWNLRMLEDSALAPRYAEIIASFDLDVVIVEEVEPNAAFLAIASELGWDGSLLNGSGSATGGIAVMTKPGIQTVSSGIAVTESASSPRSTPYVDVQMENDTVVRLYAVHLKAGTSPADEQARIDHVVALEAVVREDDIANALVLGDFNADFDDARGPEVFAPWTSDRYTVLTRPLDDDGGITYLPAGIMLDHMVATNALVDAIVAGPFIANLADEPGFDELSDHLPVVASFDRARIE